MAIATTTGTARAVGLHLAIAEVVRERLHLAADYGRARADVAATCRTSPRAAPDRAVPSEEAWEER
ncbi:hypothetical protein AB0G54_23905 [Streptomyces yokosukanensis]|uniref:hypothetical protein n=1 Tax=Streptomyces yokosukanensis TaxID=67386 RepID=UPI003423951F